MRQMRNETGHEIDASDSALGDMAPRVRCEAGRCLDLSLLIPVAEYVNEVSFVLRIPFPRSINRKTSRSTRCATNAGLNSINTIGLRTCCRGLFFPSKLTDHFFPKLAIHNIHTDRYRSLNVPYAVDEATLRDGISLCLHRPSRP
jgi:hypothetical protein